MFWRHAAVLKFGVRPGQTKAGIPDTCGRRIERLLAVVIREFQSRHICGTAPSGRISPHHQKK
jgi:hypothetical protein